MKAHLLEESKDEEVERQFMFEEHDYEVAETARLPNYTNSSDAEHGAYDPAGSIHFDQKAIFGPKPTKGVRRPRRFRIANED